MEERLPCKEKAEGSNPSRSTLVSGRSDPSKAMEGNGRAPESWASGAIEV